MKVFCRKLNISDVLAKKSLFLFGPRAVGKTTLIKQQLPEARIFDLLDENVFVNLLRNPKILGEGSQHSNIVVVDEIQRLPNLLNEVHLLIESNKKLRFVLTGSSARKLKRGVANLLGGRAWEMHLMPLVFPEIPGFDLAKYLNRGGIPFVFLSADYREELIHYINLYLREEIQAESLARNIGAFTRFLDTIGLCHGKEINFQDLASDSGVPPRTIESYITVLEDTLVGYQLPAFTKTKTRKAITRSKFYFFDVGLANSLAHRGEILEKSEAFGDAFEHFILNEMRAYLSYARTYKKMYFWRSTSHFEVDCIVDQEVAVEIKATNLVTDKHLKGLRALKEEKIMKAFFIVSQDRESRKTQDGIVILPWSDFLQKLWAGQIV